MLTLGLVSVGSYIIWKHIPVSETVRLIAGGIAVASYLTVLVMALIAQYRDA
jgi:hypothetical protein